MQQPRPSKITIPQKAHPLVKLIFKEMRDQGVTYDELEFRSGVLRSTIKAWRTDNAPGLDTVAACLGALGWTFVAAPPRNRIPPEIQAKLDEVAGEWRGYDETLCDLLTSVCHAPLVDVRYDSPPPRPPKPVKWPARPRKGYVSPGQTSLL